MEENNKLETNKEESGSGSLLYSAQSQEQAQDNRYSSVYDAASHDTQGATIQPSAPVQLAKPQPATQSQTNIVQEAIPVPVQLAKPQQTTVIPPYSGHPNPSENSQQINQNPYGQPNYNFQQANANSSQPNPMEFGPVQVPLQVQGAPAAKPKKNVAGIAIGILCAAAVVIVVAVGVLLSKSLFGGPEKRLAQGIENMTREMAVYQSSIAKDIGLVELNQLKNTKPIYTNIDLSVTDPSATSGITNIDIELDAVTDYAEKMAECDISLGTYGIEMNVGKIVASDNTLYISVPMVFHDEVYSIDLTNLGRDFNKSVWSTVLNETLPEDYSLTLFDDAKVQEDIGKITGESELQEIIWRHSKTNADDVQYETIKQKKAFTFDGVTAEYGGVRVTADKDAINASVEAMKDDFLVSDFYDEFMQGYQTTNAVDFDRFKEQVDEFIEQMFGTRYEQDPVIDVYLDKKGRIVNISTPEDIAISSAYSDAKFLAVDINFAGKERTLDVIEGGIYVQYGDEILRMGISRTANITEEFYNENLTLNLQSDSSDEDITLWYVSNWGYDDQTFELRMSMDTSRSSIEIRADGGFQDVVKGEGYTLQIKHGAITIDEEDLILMTGTIETRPTDNTIEVPQNAINILDMDESDITGLMYDTLY